MNIVVTCTISGSFIGVVGIFSSFEQVFEGIRAYENLHLENGGPRTQEVRIQPYKSLYGHRGEMYFVPGVQSTYILTANVPTDWVVGIQLPNPNAPGYTLRE